MKKILGLTIVALIVMGLVGGGTWAYFSDTETTGVNVLTAGTLDLDLSGGDDLGVVLFSLANKGPGDSDNHSTTLNFPTENAPSRLDLVFSAVNNVASNSTANPTWEFADLSGDLGANLEIAPYIDIGQDGSFTAATDIALGSGTDNHTTDALQWDSLDDFASSTWTNLYSSVDTAGTTDNFTIEWRIDGPGVGNDIQGDSANFTLTFTLSQLAAP